MRKFMKYKETISIIEAMQFNRDEVKKIINAFEEYNLKEETRYAKAHKRYKCKFSTRKPIRALFTLDFNDSDCFIKANLFTVHMYIEKVYGLSKNIQNVIIGGYNCRDCSPKCKGGVKFRFNNNDYNKCIGVNFNFADLSSDEWNEVVSLIKSEIEARVISA